MRARRPPRRLGAQPVAQADRLSARHTGDGIARPEPDLGGGFESPGAALDAPDSDALGAGALADPDELDPPVAGEPVGPGEVLWSIRMSIRPARVQGRRMQWWRALVSRAWC
ncbi:hypothetical protein GCM10009810_16550 [Nostocoides vanveenii]|uniref:Uncharacterized protein n=1 Tax=Nostocoides vanveenii TaxID=330835 RepID=A0ABP4WLW1_9MICO